MTCKYMKEYQSKYKLSFKLYKCIYPIPNPIAKQANIEYETDGLYGVVKSKCNPGDCLCYEEDYDDPFTPSASMSISKSPSPTTSSKSPIGIKPRKLANEDRFKEVCEAIARYWDKNLPIPIEWVEEYNEYVERK